MDHISRLPANLVSAGPTRPQAQAQPVDETMDSSRLCLEFSAPVGKSFAAVYAAAHWLDHRGVQQHEYLITDAKSTCWNIPTGNQVTTK